MNKESNSLLTKVLSVGKRVFDENTSFLSKILLVGGGIVALALSGKLLLWLANLPVWLFLLLGGGSFYVYRRLKGKSSKMKDQINKRGRF